MKILVADDSIVSRHLLGATLRQWGYDVVVAEDGAEAWSALNDQLDIQLAILDWVMPVLTGAEVCERVRAELDPVRYVYTIIVTAKNLKEDLVKGFESGADDYIIKPFDQTELLLRIRAGERILSRIRSSRAASC